VDTNLTGVIESLASVVPDVPKEGLTETTPLHDLGLNSIQVLRVLVALEERFHVEFDDDDFDLDKLQTIADLAAQLASKRSVDVHDGRD
jgi:acyl carrier protein